jgi:hypothetical protein
MRIYSDEGETWEYDISRLVLWAQELFDEPVSLGVGITLPSEQSTQNEQECPSRVSF